MNKDNVADSSNFESKTEYLRLRKSSKLKKGSLLRIYFSYH
ncbi:hypothetical protein [Caldisphaera sp.]